MLDDDVPFALAVVGAAGSGKSTIALESARRTAATYLDKDSLAGPLVEAVMAAQGHSSEERESNAFYRERLMPAEYEAIFAVARDNLQLGRSIVIDAPFAAYLHQPEFYTDATRAAQGPPAKRSVLHVFASEAETRRRLETRGLSRDRVKLDNWDEFWPTWGHLDIAWADVRILRVNNDLTADIESVLRLMKD